MLTAEVTSLIEKTTKARITEIYLFWRDKFLPDISVCNTNLPRGLNEKENEKHKRIVTNEDLKYKMRDNDWLFRTKLQV